MKLKRLFAALIAVALLVSFAGCGSLIRKVVGAAGKTDTPAEPSQSVGKTEKPPKTTAEPTQAPEPTQVPELTPEEEFYASMIGDYRFLEIGLGGDEWGAKWNYEWQRQEEERIAAAGPTVSLRADGTGTLVFDDERHDFTWSFDEAEINYVKETGLPGSYSDHFRLDDGEEVLFSFARRILTFEYKDWISVYTTMNEAEYEEYQASFDVHPEADYRLGEPRIINAVYDTGFVNQKILIPVYNSGSETVYLSDMHLVVRDRDGAVVYDNTCYGRNPEILRPGEDGAFIEWIGTGYFQNGYSSLSPDMTVEIDDVVIFPQNEDYIHDMPLSNVSLDKAAGCVRGTIRNDTGDLVIGFIHEGERWENAHYFYYTHISCYDAAGTLIYSQGFSDTESLDVDQTLDFSAPIYWLEEGYTYDDIDSFRIWSYILDYETTEKR